MTFVSMNEKDVMDLQYAPDDNKPEEVKKVPQRSCSTMKRLPSITMSKWTDRPWGLDGFGWQYLWRYPPSCCDVNESSIFPQMTSLLIWINLAFWPS